MEFVKGWSIIQTLGEGAYGEVKLLLNNATGETVAMKVIEIAEKGKEASESVRKEVAVHRALSHSHIIRYYGRRREPKVEYIFLEYAPHGELFDRIEPDKGMNQWEAQKYLKQIILGVQYLHNRGVTHRDLKPENILLDANDNIKISDFGMATVFRAAGKERLLEKKCGTLPYVAPEVLKRPYAAEPADVWSCGVILVAMLAGELPWDEASEKCREYVNWMKGRSYLGLSPWCKLDTLALALLRKILSPLPSTRYTIKDIISHRWTKANFNPKEPPVHYEGVLKNIGGEEDWFSQPIGGVMNINSPKLVGKRKRGESPPPSFSQPTLIEDLLISTQQLCTQSPSTQNSLQKLVRRMTRFFVAISIEETFQELKSSLSKLKLAYKTSWPGQVTINTVDKRKSILVFKATLIEMEKKTMVDFRLSKGCGLEFKRRFILIRDMMDWTIVSPPPISAPP